MIRKTKKVLVFIGVFLFLWAILYFFYHVNTLNYIKQKHIESSLIKHPEKIPSSTAAKLSSFGFMNIMADMYWLSAIQYIWGNVISGEYKKYLSVLMDLITDMNPYFEAPYTIGMLLIPSDDGVADNTENPNNIKKYQDAKKLGLKGIKNFCDPEKIQLISQENNLQKIISDPQYKNPCKNYSIPYYLAYVYYFYLKENTQASLYYKIVSAQDDAPKWARVLAAIMQGKGGEREKSLFMFLSLAENAASSNEACSILTSDLQRAYDSISNQKLELTGAFIARIENARKRYLPEITQENENKILADTECTNFLAKAIREINLMYLEQADKKYILDFPDEISAQSPQRLFETGYIDFIPTDYQQYDDKDYGIVYRYNTDIWRFDYEMGY